MLGKADCKPLEILGVHKRYCKWWQLYTNSHLTGSNEILNSHIPNYKRVCTHTCATTLFQLFFYIPFWGGKNPQQPQNKTLPLHLCATGYRSHWERTKFWNYLSWSFFIWPKSLVFEQGCVDCWCEIICKAENTTFQTLRVSQEATVVSVAFEMHFKISFDKSDIPSNGEAFMSSMCPNTFRFLHPVTRLTVCPIRIDVNPKRLNKWASY